MTIDQIIETHAHQFTNQPRPKGFRRWKGGHCFKASQALACRHPDLTYVEGIVSGIHHAWVVDPDGKVIDSTWPYVPSLTYVGVPVISKYVAQVMINEGAHVPVLIQMVSMTDAEVAAVVKNPQAALRAA